MRFEIWKDSRALAVLAIALGIGATTAIFSVVNALLLRPLPYRDPGQLVWAWERTPQGRRAGVSPANFMDWRAQSRAFGQMAAYDFVGFNLTGGPEPEQIVGAWVSADFFSLLGVEAALGRGFRPEEDRPRGERVVVIGHGLWQRRFGSDPGIVGRKIQLNGESFTVVGVLPRDFWFMLGTVELWAPLVLNAGQLGDREARSFDVIARPRAGVSRAQAAAEMETIAARLAAAHPRTNGGWGVMLESIEENFLSYFRPTLFLLLGAAGVVLLISCANVANLLLARATARGREIAIRAALGATRWRIVRQLLAESLLLALAGGACGALLAWWGVDLVVALIPGEIQRRIPGGVGAVGFDARTLGFAALVSLFTGLLFGLAPALHASRPDLTRALKVGGAAGEGRGRRRARDLLVVAEIALALVLLAGAGLLIRSLVRVQRAELGFDPRHVLRMGLPMTGAGDSAGGEQAARYRRILERVAALPGVQSAALANNLLAGPRDPGLPLTIEGRAAAAPGETPLAINRVVSPNYFETLGVPLRAGRDFNEWDRPGAPAVAIISRSLAERHWPGADPLGRRLRLGGSQSDSPWLTVVGVVGDVRHPLSAAPQPTVYRAQGQTPRAWMYLIARAAPDPAALFAAARGAVREAEAGQAISGLGTMEEWLGESVAEPRFVMTLLGLFAAVAVALAAVGVYGLMSYAVGRRTREIGVRVALGAQAGDVVRLVVREGMWLALAGIALGLIVAAAASRLLAPFLFGLDPADPPTLVSISLLLAGVALLACYLPARRAARVDPLVALRHE